MRREELVDLNAFLAVAEERSFTRAAAKLGTSQSALSYTIRRLEDAARRPPLDPNHAERRAHRGRRAAAADCSARRSTRSAPSSPRSASCARSPPARSASPRASMRRSDPLACSGEAAAALSGHRGGGHHRLRTDRHRGRALRRRRSPWRAGGQDMIAVRIGPDMRMARRRRAFLLRKRPKPRTPQDLTAHACINLRLPTYGGLYAWEFEKHGRELKVRVEGQLVFNNVALSAQRGPGRIRPAVRAGGPGADARRRRTARPGARGLVPALRQAITSTIRAAAKRRRPSPCWSRRCVIGSNGRATRSLSSRA